MDVGNTSIGIGRHDGERIVVTRVSRPEEAAELLLGDAVGIAVSQPRWDALSQAVDARGRATLRQLTGVPVEVVDPRLARSAGADRLAAVLGAQPGPAVVVDAGTAVTVDLLDAHGVFRGGFIAAGPGVALSGLHAGAPALPLLPARDLARGQEDGQPRPGLDTEGALLGGAWGMAVGGVDRLVDAALDSPGMENARLLVTGGWGLAWMAVSRHAPEDGSSAAPRSGVLSTRVVLWDEALVHRGIARWADGAPS